MNLWKCDDGTFDITDDQGEVVYYNVPQNVLADSYDTAQRTAGALADIPSMLATLDAIHAVIENGSPTPRLVIADILRGVGYEVQS